MTTPKLKFYPSSSGFVFGNSGVIVDYNSGCLRYLAIGQNKVFKALDPKYEHLGKFHEEMHATSLKWSALLEDQEVSVKFDIEPGVEYSGRCDFLTTDGGIDETKASMSKNMLYKVINKKEYKIGHLAQLVSYLIQFKRDHGRIVVGYYEQTGPESFKFKKGATFKVNIKEEGKIYVNDQYSGYTIGDQLRHTFLASQALKTRKIMDRPVNHVDFDSPCKFCSLRTLCDKYDNKQLTEQELVSQGEKLLREGALDGK